MIHFCNKVDKYAASQIQPIFLLVFLISSIQYLDRDFKPETFVREAQTPPCQSPVHQMDDVVVLYL